MPWSSEETNRLLNEVARAEGLRVDWKTVASLFDGKYTPEQCKQKWRSRLGKNKPRSWKPYERSLLRHVVELDSAETIDWDRIKGYFFARTGAQCRAEWARMSQHSNKKPRWDPHEIEMLRIKGPKKCMEQYGKRSLEAYRRMYMRIRNKTD